ncbi:MULTISPECIES: hypothetical protein [unclassified Listeria]|uniref:hypothetical protein n=1 Tax=unclassified Listeria TaxID=2642072 RepID=UPI000B590163|nr:MULTISPECIES: hypothetical protein [unclassified Listeria]
MKLYAVRTEECEELIHNLEEQGCKWTDGVMPNPQKIWNEFKEETVIRQSDYDFLFHNCRKFYEIVYPNIPIVDYLKKSE